MRLPGVPKDRRRHFYGSKKYQWTTDEVPVPQLGETRKGHVNLMTAEDWVRDMKRSGVAVYSDDRYELGLRGGESV